MRFFFLQSIDPTYIYLIFWGWPCHVFSTLTYRLTCLTIFLVDGSLIYDDYLPIQFLHAKCLLKILLTFPIIIGRLSAMWIFQKIFFDDKSPRMKIFNIHLRKWFKTFFSTYSSSLSLSLEGITLKIKLKTFPQQHRLSLQTIIEWKAAMEIFDIVLSPLNLIIAKSITSSL